MTDKPILVTGATGKTGSRIVNRLEARGETVRRGSRKAPAPFDWERPDTWQAALRDTRAAYICFYPDFAFPGALATLEAFTQAASESGVERLAMITGRGESHARLAEDIVQSSDLATTILQSAWFAQNFSEGSLRDAVLAGVIPMPGGDVLEPIVDIDDVADVAAAALTEDGHAGRVYEVTGPRLLTFAQIADVLTEVSGRSVRYLPTTYEQFHAELAAVAGELYADIVTSIAQETFDGRNAHVADGVERALGRPPRDFRQFAEHAASTGAWPAAA